MIKKNWAWIFLIIMLSVIFTLGLLRGAVFTTGNDFDWHYEQGTVVLQVAEGLHTNRIAAHYPPARVAYNAMLNIVKVSSAKKIQFFISFFGFVLALFLWSSMANRIKSNCNISVTVLANALALFAMIFYVIRDFDDCGLQIFLLCMLVFAAWLLYKGHSISSGIMLALAVSWKTSPLLFLPFLLYKRQWKATISLALAIIFFNTVPPMLIFGKAETIRQLGTMKNMFQMAVLPDTVAESDIPGHLKHSGSESSIIGLKDPRRNPVEVARNQNQALKPAIGRYLIHSKPGDTLYITTEGNWENGSSIGEGVSNHNAPPHPLWKQFLNLPILPASKVAMVIILAIGLAIAWRMRRAWKFHIKRGSNEVDDVSFLQEWSAAMIFVALLSPMCWLQHLVLLLPALILVIRDALNYKLDWGWWRYCCMAFLILPMWLLERDFIGKELSIIALSYKFHTLGALFLVLLVLMSRERGASK